jgi:hypothetical protein
VDLKEARFTINDLRDKLDAMDREAARKHPKRTDHSLEGWAKNPDPATFFDHGNEDQHIVDVDHSSLTAAEKAATAEVYITPSGKPAPLSLGTKAPLQEQFGMVDTTTKTPITYSSVAAQPADSSRLRSTNKKGSMDTSSSLSMTKQGDGRSIITPQSLTEEDITRTSGAMRPNRPLSVRLLDCLKPLGLP